MTVGAIREWQRIIAELRSAIGRQPAQIGSETIRQNVREIVDAYFRTDRPILLHSLRDETLFANIDGCMQDLLSSAQKRTLKTRYLITINRLKKEWETLELSSVPKFGDMTGGEIPEYTDTEQQILATLKDICPTSWACYRQALEDFAGNSRNSWRGTASELREALRELLDKLAPDKEVEKSPGFKLEPDAKKPTMRQKVRFILKSRSMGKSQIDPVADTVNIVDEIFGSLVRSVYNRSSVSVHVGKEKEEVKRVKRYVDVLFMELLELDNE